MTAGNPSRTTLLATVIVVASGVVWGFYWLPVRALTGLGLGGAWGTAAITAAAMLVLCPYAIIKRQQIATGNRMAMLSIAVGGIAFALYSIGFVYGRVAIIILLYFLTPVWSTLIARYIMGWHTPRLRILAIIVGLIGLGVMLSSDGDWPIPRGIGEWMGLFAGLLWSFATTGIRTTSNLDPGASGFIFACGATAGALSLAPFLEPFPSLGLTGDMGLIALSTGAFWWGICVVCLMWATVRLEPARVGILLMAEVVVGAVSAAVLAGEHLSPLEIAGGALVLVAGILEVWPTRKPQGPPL